MTMLLAPVRPVFANVRFPRVLGDGQRELDLDGFGFLARRSFLLHDVNASDAAIPFHSEPCDITRWAHP